MAKKLDKPKKNYEVGNKKPPKQFQFKKGQVANPTGINQPKHIRAMQDLTADTLAKAIEMIMTGSMEDLRNALKDKNLSIAQSIIIKAAIKANKDGSFYQLDGILDRGIGKVVEKREHKINAPSTIIFQEEKSDDTSDS
jgi:hypothetical protein